MSSLFPTIIYAIGGNICAGKSTLIQHIKRKNKKFCDIVSIPESVINWQANLIDFYDNLSSSLILDACFVNVNLVFDGREELLLDTVPANPISDIGDKFFNLQKDILQYWRNIYNQIIELKQIQWKLDLKKPLVIVIERSVREAMFVFLRALGWTIGKQNLLQLWKEFAELENKFTEIAHIKYFYINTPSNICTKRIKERAFDYDKSITDGRYIRLLEIYYVDFFQRPTNSPLMPYWLKPILRYTYFFGENNNDYFSGLVKAFEIFTEDIHNKQT